MRSSRHLLQLLGVFVAAIGLTVFLGGHQRSDAVTLPGAFLSSPISPLPTPTPTATPELHRHSLPMIRGGTYHRHWLPVLIGRS